MNKRKKREKDITFPIPPVTTQTQKTLELMTEPAGFQRLCDDVLSACWGYQIKPRGVNIHGTIVGQPDSWAIDTNGKLCALAYGINSGGDWESKLDDDLKSVFAFVQNIAPESRPDVFVFCTNCSINSSYEQFLKKRIQDQYGWEFHLFGSGEFSVCLDTKRQDLRYKHLKIRVEHHNWQSLLAACQNQRQLSSVRHEVAIDTDIYVPRHLERNIDAWYYQAIQSVNSKNRPGISSSELGQVASSPQQLFVIVDQAGAGKSTLVIHLAERYGNVGPVIILPGSMTITHDHALTYAIVESLKDSSDNRTYHSDLKALCQLAQSEGYPLLVIIDAIDANNQPKHLQNALKQLLASYQDSSLFILVTCRDAAWSYFFDALFHSFTYKDTEQSLTDGVFSLGLYDDDEFEIARKRYFHRWNIHADLGPNATRVLRSPLLLSVFAQVYSGHSLGYVPELSDDELWNTYWDNKIEAISKGMDYSLDQEAISNVLEMLAERMIEYDSPQLFLRDLRGIDYLDPYDTNPKSLMTQLQNTGILQKTQVGGRSNAVQFVYDLFLEFILARKLAYEFEQPSKRVVILERIEKLAIGYRWHRMVLYLIGLVSEPNALIDKLRSANLWLAAQALLRSERRTTHLVRQQIIQDLSHKLDNRYVLNCRRASLYLRLLNAHESEEMLFKCWTERHLSTTLLALAQLGRVEIAKPLIRYLGRYPQWYLPEDQELVDALPGYFRDYLQTMALEMLENSEYQSAAAQTLGFLRAEQAVDPLFVQFETSEWTDEEMALALIHIGTERAFDAIERAFTKMGELIEDYDQRAQPIHTLEEQVRPLRPSCDELYGTLMVIHVDGIQHSPSREMLPLLARLLEHPSFSVRCEAIHSIQALNLAEMAIPLILSARLGETEAITRALDTFGPQIRVESVLALLEDPTTSEQVRGYAIQALGFSRDPRSLGPLTLLINQQQYLIKTIQALGNLGYPEAIPVLAQVLNKDWPDHPHQSIIYEFAIVALGRLRHSNAFAPLERFVHHAQFAVQPATIEALVATGGEKALTLLSEIWKTSTLDFIRRAIMGALLWLNTEKSITTLLQLLSPIDKAKVLLLVAEMMQGKNLGWIDGQISHNSLDDRIIILLTSSFDLLSLNDQHHALIALAHAGGASAYHFLKTIAENSTYKIPLPTGASISGEHTLSTEALRLLREKGISAAIDSALDEILVMATRGFTGGEGTLAKMDRAVVIEALQRRLDTKDELILVRLLELLGIFGDLRVLPEIHHFMSDSRPKVFNVAYEAEQRILGIMDIWEW